MTLHAKIVTPGLQRYPWNLYLIKNVEVNIVFRTRKFIVLIIFLSFLLKARNAAYQCHFHRESANENKQCIQTKTCISNLYLMGTVVNRALLSLPGEITLTVPLIQVSTRFCLIWFRTFRDFLIFALLASIMGSQESYTRNSKSLFTKYRTAQFLGG